MLTLLKINKSAVIRNFLFIETSLFLKQHIHCQTGINRCIMNSLA